MSEPDEMNEPAFRAVGLAAEPATPPAGLLEQILATARIPVRERMIMIPAGRWRGVARVPLGAVAALVVVALIAGLLVGDRIGESRAPAPPSQVAHFTLTGSGSMAGASATVTDLKQDGIALVSFSGLPDVPSGKLYEVWLITPDNHAESVGIFLPDLNGQRLFVIEKPLKGYKLMAVTVEDAPNGVDQPTQQPQLVGSIA
jgi:anti-sigma-K factor RskA